MISLIFCLSFVFVRPNKRNICSRFSFCCLPFFTEFYVLLAVCTCVELLPFPIKLNSCCLSARLISTWYGVLIDGLRSITLKTKTLFSSLSIKIFHEAKLIEQFSDNVAVYSHTDDANYYRVCCFVRLWVRGKTGLILWTRVREQQQRAVREIERDSSINLIRRTIPYCKFIQGLTTALGFFKRLVH